MKSESPPLAIKAPQEESAEQKSIAGRKKMKGGEKWDMATGKESAMVEHHAASAKEGKTKAVETEEEHQVEVELNSILKKGPSKSTPPTHPAFLSGCGVLPRNLQSATRVSNP